MPHLIPAAGRTLRRVALLGILAPVMLSAQQTTGTLVGRVLAGDVAVPSATIILSGGRVTLARQDGRFSVAAPPGRYEVRAQRVGYTTARDTVTIVAGHTSVLNFKIERAAAMLEAVTSVASRGQVRSAIDAPAPVIDVAGPDLRATGRTETALALQALEPSVNVPRGGVAVSSDLIHPLTMRGLGPDQVLVLVNGKRRHSSALMNANNTVGRGSVGVDLSAIPAEMIDHIEILRDGGTAQYGSDAVAGVINVVLKSGVHGDAATTMGRSATTYNRDGDGVSYPGGTRSADDGRVAQASIDKGVVFGERGFLHGGFEVRDRGYTNRALPVSGGAVDYRMGDAQSHDGALFLNGGNLFANGLELYANAGASRRTMGAAAAYFPPTLTTGGLLPIIRPTIDDGAGTVGLRGQLADWDWDLGTTYGRNTVGYAQDYQTTATTAGNPQSVPDLGSVRYGQSTTTLELTRTFSYFDETRVAAGAELRAESYRITAGSNATFPFYGFPGFTASQATNQSRHDVAGYLDLESDLTSNVMVGLAGRAEQYSDVGGVGAGKLSLRWEPVRKYALRASIERGFRVPSLAQAYFATQPENVGGSVTVPGVIAAGVSGPAGLRPERTMTYSIGTAVEPASALSLSADLYRVDVKDRVVLVDQAPGVPSRAANGADTRTTGLDVTANYVLGLATAGTLRLGAGLDLNATTVTRAMNDGVSAFTPLSVSRFERGQPRSDLLLSASYAHGNRGVLLRTQRFGDVTTADGTSAPRTLGSRWITDANVSYTLLRKYTFTAGADNLFDVYPDRVSPSGLGVSPYNAASPFGYNGRFVFGRLSIYL